MNSPLKELQDLIGPVYDGLDCPAFLQEHPDDTFGWDGDNPIIKHVVWRNAPRLIVEVGTWKGQSAFSMLDECVRCGIDAHLICVDTWLGAVEHWFDHRWQMRLKHGEPQLYQQFLANVIRRRYQKRLTPFRLPSTVAAAVFQRLELQPDLVYLDASHLEDDVYGELNAYHALRHSGTVIFGHDYGDHAPGVVKALARFSLDQGVDYHTEGAFWVLDT